MSDGKEPMPRTSAGDARLGPGRPDIAASTTATWQAIDRALQPILGRRGVEALYWRSLQLAAGSHPWLVDDSESADGAMDLTALASAVAGQDAESADAGCRALLDHFKDLLVSLVGASLTDRLLATVPATHADTPNPQDTSP